MHTTRCTLHMIIILLTYIHTWHDIKKQTNLCSMFRNLAWQSVNDNVRGVHLIRNAHWEVITDPVFRGSTKIKLVRYKNPYLLHALHFHRLLEHGGQSLFDMGRPIWFVEPKPRWSHSRFLILGDTNILAVSERDGEISFLRKSVKLDFNPRDPCILSTNPLERDPGSIIGPEEGCWKLIEHDDKFFFYFVN